MKRDGDPALTKHPSVQHQGTCKSTIKGWLGRRVRRALVLILVAVAFAGLAMGAWFFPYGREVLPALEARFARPQLPEAAAISGIIVLGGEDQRVVEAGRLGVLLAGPPVIVSGMDPVHAKELLEDAGLAANRIALEPNAQSTAENAELLRIQLKPAPDQIWVLVTSASHMPRAAGTFRKAGFCVLAWPVPETAVDPQDAGRRARHEVLGLLAYWIDGRSTALFPKSSDPCWK